MTVIRLVPPLSTGVWTFRPTDSSPHRGFAPCMDISPHRRFAPCTWGEMSSVGRNVHGANRQWGETSIHGAKRPRGELSVGGKSINPTATAEWGNI